MVLKFLIMQSFAILCYFLSLGSRLLPQKPILEHTEPRSSLRVRDQDSDSQNTRAEIMALNTLNFIVLDSKRENIRSGTEW